MAGGDDGAWAGGVEGFGQDDGVVRRLGGGGEDVGGGGGDAGEGLKGEMK